MNKTNKKRTVVILTILIIYLLGMITVPVMEILQQNQKFSVAMKTNPAIAEVRQIEMMYDRIYVMSMYPKEETNGATAWIIIDKNRFLAIPEDERGSYILRAYWAVLNALRELYPDVGYYQIFGGYVAIVDTVDGKNHGIRASVELVVYPVGTDELIVAGKENFGEVVDNLVARGMAYFRSLVFRSVLLDSNHVMLRPVGFKYSWEIDK